MSSDSEGEATFAPRILGKDDGQATYIGLLKKVQLDGPPSKGKAGKPSHKKSSSSESISKPLTKRASTSSLASSVASSSSRRSELPSDDDDDVPLAQQQHKRDHSVISGGDDEDQGGARGGGGGRRGGDKKTLVLEDVKFGPESDEKKPEPTYYTLLKHALLFSPQKKLTLAQIYDALEGRWPWFAKAGKGWKNTVRNNLSLGPSFQKIEAAAVATELGTLERGTYWSFNPDAPEGCPRHERQKKRGRSSSAKTEEEKIALANKSRGRRKSDPVSDVEEESEIVAMPGIVEGSSEGGAVKHEGEISFGEPFARGGGMEEDQDSVRSNGSTAFASWNASSSSLTDGSRPIPIPSPLVLSSPQGDTTSTLSPMSSSSLSPLPSPMDRAFVRSSPPPVFHIPSSSSSFDPIDPTSLSLFSSTPSPFSANSPLLSPSSASTSYSFLESWYSPPSRVPSCLPGNTNVNEFGLSTSAGSGSSMSFDQPKPTFASATGLPTKLQLHYPSHPLDSPSSEFIHNPSSSNEKETPFFSPGLTPRASESGPSGPASTANASSSFFLLAQTHTQPPPHQPSPLQNIQLPPSNETYSPSSFSTAVEPTPRTKHPLETTLSLPPPRFEPNAFSSSTFELSGSVPALGLRGLGAGMEDMVMEDGSSDLDAEGESEEEEEDDQATRREEDLSVVLSGKSAEFWRGLWAGWNAASPAAAGGGEDGIGGEGGRG